MRTFFHLQRIFLHQRHEDVSAFDTSSCLFAEPQILLRVAVVLRGGA